MNDQERLTWRLRLGMPGGIPGRQGPPRGDLSASKVKLLDKCDLAYSLGRIEKLDERPGEARLRGSLCHRVLETVARPRVLGFKTGKPSESELRETMREEAARFRCSSGVIASAWDVLEGLADRLDFSNTIAVEENWTIEFPQDALAGPPFKLVGAIDRLDVHLDAEAGTHVVHVHDYKSGAFAASVGELIEDPQAMFYVAWVRHGGWQGPIRVTFHYLGAGFPTTFLAPPSMPQKGLDLAMTKMAELRGKTEWKASTGPHCVGCDFRTHCPAYKAMLASPNPEVFPVTTDGELLREYARCRTLAKVFTEAKDACGDALKAKLQNVDRVIGGGLRAQMRNAPKSRLPDDLAGVAGAVARQANLEPGEVEREIAGVNERKLKGLLGRLDPQVRATVKDALDELREVYDVTTSIDVRGIAGGF